MTTMTSRPNGVPEWDLIDRLYKAMRVRGVHNATDMGDLLGMHRNSIQDYLKGKRLPDHRTMLAWAMACGVSAEWLEFGIDETPDGGPNGGEQAPLPFTKRATRPAPKRTDVLSGASRSWRLSSPVCAPLPAAA